jgi:thiamine biosynthesis protein ThiI
MKEAAWAVAEPRTYESFRISARRAFKDLPFGSLEVNVALGDHLHAKRPAAVKMKGADLDVRVEMVPRGAFIYADKLPGPSGLPVGITGSVCALLSGGIDSPVAAYRLMRRGCRVVFVHFHGHPYVTRASLDKAEDLAGLLVRHQYEGILYAVAFGALQARIVERAPARLRVVLYRRFMVRIAAALARRHRCKALVTGEALAQVASQTLTNMIVIDDASPLVILRPLIGYDKLEIEAHAKALETYPISILPDQDCCTLFTPRSPETHAKLEHVRTVEAELDVDAMVAEAVEAAERRDLRSPWWEPQTAPETEAEPAPPA